MAEKLGIDSNPHELKLGKSFEPKSKVALHSIRYDFKPESLDATKTSILEVEKNNSLTMTVPHVEGSGTSHTVYKGNKRPVQKECVLIIDHDSGEFFLEKISNAIQLKKTRTEGSSKISKSFLNAEKPPEKKQEVKKAKQPKPESDKPVQTAPVQSVSVQAAPIRKEPEKAPSPVDMIMSDSSGSSDSESEAERENMETYTTISYQKPPPNPTSMNAPPDVNHFSNLSHDLQLSDTGSDSD